jgi:hypothetical protein
MAMWPATDRQPTVGLLTTPASTMGPVLLTVFAAWTGLAVPASVVVGLVVRGGEDEDDVTQRAAPCRRTPPWGTLPGMPGEPTDRIP